MARIRKARCGDGWGHDPLEDREAWGFGLLAVDAGVEAGHGAGAGAAGEWVDGRGEGAGGVELGFGLRVGGWMDGWMDVCHVINPWHKHLHQ